MTIAVELVVLVLCVTACVQAVNGMEESPDTRMGYFAAVLVWGAAAVLVSYWLGQSVMGWFMSEFQHGE